MITMPKSMTVSVSKDKRSSTKHNFRKTFLANASEKEKDAFYKKYGHEHLHRDLLQLNEDICLNDAGKIYDKYFGQAIEDYNKGKRRDRKIGKGKAITRAEKEQNMKLWKEVMTDPVMQKKLHVTAKQAERKFRHYRHVKTLGEALYAKQKASKIGNPFYELAIQVGNATNYNEHDDKGDLLDKNGNIITTKGDKRSLEFVSYDRTDPNGIWQQVKKPLKDYLKSFHKRNPNLVVLSASIHMDEASPHMQLQFIPVAEADKMTARGKSKHVRGLKVRPSFNGALECEGFKRNMKDNRGQMRAWQAREQQALAMALYQDLGIERQKGMTNHLENTKAYKDASAELAQAHQNTLDEQKTLQKAQNDLQTANDTLKDRQSNVKTVNKIVKGKQDKIKTLNSQIKGKQTTINNLDNTISDKNNTITGLDTTIKDKQKDYDDLQNDYNELVPKFNNKQAELDKKAQEEADEREEKAKQKAIDKAKAEQKQALKAQYRQIVSQANIKAANQNKKDRQKLEQEKALNDKVSRELYGYTDKQGVYHKGQVQILHERQQAFEQTQQDLQKQIDESDLKSMNACQLAWSDKQQAQEKQNQAQTILDEANSKYEETNNLFSQVKSVVTSFSKGLIIGSLQALYSHKHTREQALQEAKDEYSKHSRQFESKPISMIGKALVKFKPNELLNGFKRGIADVGSNIKNVNVNSLDKALSNIKLIKPPKSIKDIKTPTISKQAKTAQKAPMDFKKRLKELKYDPKFLHLHKDFENSFANQFFIRREGESQDGFVARVRHNKKVAKFEKNMLTFRDPMRALSTAYQGLLKYSANHDTVEHTGDMNEIGDFTKVIEQELEQDKSNLRLDQVVGD